MDIFSRLSFFSQHLFQGHRRRMWNLVCLAVLLTGVFAEEYARLSPEDYETLNSLPAPRATLPAGFKYKYVSKDGSIHDSRPSGESIPVYASPKTGNTAHYDAALVVSHQTRNMPSLVFSNMAREASVGVFTRAETMSVYPAYYHLREPAGCHGSCAGHCSASCTFDGRKWATVAGAGGKMCSILDDNVSCSSRDPYRHGENILVHEFTHTTHHHGLDSSHKSQVLAAYNHAKSHNLWTGGDKYNYAMSNYEEYFAEAAEVFFHTTTRTIAGGMNICGHSKCASEQAARHHLQQHDPQVYNVLSWAFTNNRPQLPGHLYPCQKN